MLPLAAAEATLWLPVVVPGAIAGVYLVLAGKSSTVQRVLGIALLVLTPIAAYTLTVWFEDGCFEGYESAECGYSGIGWLLSMVVLVVAGATALFALYTLIRMIIRWVSRRTEDHGSANT